MTNDPSQPGGDRTPEEGREETASEGAQIYRSPSDSSSGGMGGYNQPGSSGGYSQPSPGESSGPAGGYTPPPSSGYGSTPPPGSPYSPTPLDADCYGHGDDVRVGSRAWGHLIQSYIGAGDQAKRRDL